MSFFGDVHKHAVELVGLIGEHNRLMSGAYYLLGFALWTLIIPSMSILNYFENRKKNIKVYSCHLCGYSTPHKKQFIVHLREEYSNPDVYELSKPFSGVRL